MATQLQLDREHPNRLVFSPEAGLDPAVDVVLAGSRLRAHINGRASAWQDHIVLTSGPRSNAPAGAGAPLDTQSDATIAGAAVPSRLAALSWRARRMACSAAVRAPQESSMHHRRSMVIMSATLSQWCSQNRRKAAEDRRGSPQHRGHLVLDPHNQVAESV